MNKELSIRKFSHLYDMIMADGVIDPREIKLFHQIGHTVYHLTNDEIVESIAVAGNSVVNPKTEEDYLRLLYELALMAWADGNVCDQEKELLCNKAKQFGVKESLIEELVNRLLGLAKEKAGEDDVIKQLNK